MTTNQRFVRELVLITVVLGLVIAAALHLAPARRLDHFAPHPAVAVAGAPSARAGARLFQSKGCAQCHTVDGTARIGPSFLHDYGSRILLASGDTVTMDDAYIRESLLAPRAKARPGFPPSMPSFDGMLNDREIERLSAYLESLR